MKKLLQFRQLGQLKTIFVFGNYPVFEQDVQQLVNEGVSAPKDLRKQLHELGLKRMLGDKTR